MRISPFVNQLWDTALAKRFTIFSDFTWIYQIVFWTGAIMVGLVIVGMTLLSEWAAETHRALASQWPWFSIVVPPAGLALTAWITRRFFTGCEGSGIPQVKTALEIASTAEERTRLVSFRIAVGKMVLPITGLLSGASVGFGGPAVHVGASIMLSLGLAARFPAHYMERGLILAGSAAGFAAMFSAPLAGIMFALEELGRTMEERISSLVLTAIIFSGITAYALLNRYIYLEDESLIMPWGISWLAIPICALTGGALGGLFSRACITGQRFLRNRHMPFLLTALLCGSVIAALNYYSHGDTAGTGYQQVKAILHNSAAMNEAYPWMKIATVCATFFSGVPSGIFVPTLAVGAGFGADLAPQMTFVPASAVIFLTMAAYFSGVLQLPLTSFVLTMEMTNNHSMLIPLMATTFLASAVAKLINPKPLYAGLCESYQGLIGVLRQKPDGNQEQTAKPSQK